MTKYHKKVAMLGFSERNLSKEQVIDKYNKLIAGYNELVGENIEKIHQEVAVDLVRTIFETIDWSKDKTIFENGILELISEYCIDLKIKERVHKETAKDFIFKVESYLGYNDDNETFTKKELLLILAEVAKEQFGVEVEE